MSDIFLSLSRASGEFRVQKYFQPAGGDAYRPDANRLNADCCLSVIVDRTRNLNYSKTKQ